MQQQGDAAAAAESGLEHLIGGTTACERQGLQGLSLESGGVGVLCHLDLLQIWLRSRGLVDCLGGI
jgi:hypothetical protein